MRIVTAAEGKQIVNVSRAEWLSIGKSAGWIVHKAGLEARVSDVLENARFRFGHDFYFRDGLRIEDPAMAQRAIEILNATGEFGHASYDDVDGVITFGVHPQFQNQSAGGGERLPKPCNCVDHGKNNDTPRDQFDPDCLVCQMHKAHDHLHLGLNEKQQCPECSKGGLVKCKCGAYH